MYVFSVSFVCNISLAEISKSVACKLDVKKIEEVVISVSYAGALVETDVRAIMHNGS